MHPNLIFVVNALACLALAYLRVSDHKGVQFQAVAHLYVGGLFVYGWGRRSGGWRDTRSETWPYRTFDQTAGTRVYLRMAWALSLVELFTALYQRGRLNFLFN